MLPVRNHQDRTSDSGDDDHRDEFVVKIDDGKDSESKNNNLVRGVETAESRIWRESSYDFMKDSAVMGRDGGNAGKNGGGADGFFFPQRSGSVEDPPSRLIGQFLHKQKASGETLLDMDLEMEELQSEQYGDLQPVSESPKELRVSYQEASRKNHVEISPESVLQKQDDDDSSDEEKLHSNQKPKPQRSPSLDGHEDGSRGRNGVVRCTSNAAFRPTLNSDFLRNKTKSRLIDPVHVEELERKSAKNSAKSGLLKVGNSGTIEEEEEDPCFDDIPEEFRNTKLSAVILIEWIILFLIIAAFIASLTVPLLQKKLIGGFHLWKWEVLVLVLVCGRLVSGWAIRIAVFFIERNFTLRKRVLYFVYVVRKAVQNCIWLGLVLIVWYSLLDKKVRTDRHTSILSYVTKFLVCLLVSTAIWLVKTLVVKILASSFHVNAYFDRIQDSLFSQYVIEALSGTPLIEFDNYTGEENEKCIAEIRQLQNAGATMPAELAEAALPSSGRVIGSGLQKSPRVTKSPEISGSLSRRRDEGITIDLLHKLNQKNISAWHMKRLMHIIRRGTITTLHEPIDSNHHEKAGTQINSELEAKAVAKEIFKNVAKPRSKYIHLEDLLCFMREDEAFKTLSLFEGATDSKRISKSALKNWVVNAFRERRALALTLDDTKTTVKKLHHIINIIVGAVIIIVGLLILGIATTHFLVLISSQLLLVVFIFGNTCKTTFEAIIFLFGIHPFDVGDRCEIEEVQLVVEEMNILSTVFLRYDNLKITYPNNVLATLPISNYYRSPHMGDAIDFCIHVSTPLEKVATMKQRIIRYTEIKEDHWAPGAMVVLRDIEDMNKLKISVWLAHRMNFQDMGERFARRERLVEEIVKILKELEIEYRMLPLDINVRNMPAGNLTRLPSNWTACSH